MDTTAMSPSTESVTAVEYRSAGPFTRTVERLVEAIEAGGMQVFARIDHAAGAREAGLFMPPTMLILYGNPKAGTPIMLAAPAAALELPLRVVVREDVDGSVRLLFRPIEPILRDAGVPVGLASRLDATQRALLAALAV
jgi:uncharacterized protein (DUF302 family)